jgi:acetolactate synthase-1/2/3 large subunit
MYLGAEPGALLAEADLVIVIESDVPWIPSMQHPPVGCRVANIGEDPAFTRYPMRSFPSDLAIKADAATALVALDEALVGKLARAEGRIAARRTRILERARTRRAQLTKDTSPGGEKISRPYLNHAIAEVVGEDAIVFNEYPLNLDHCPREKPGTFFSVSPAGGLGWGLGAALGAKLAAPDKLVVAAVGDGAYMFTNPTVCHWVGGAFDLPVLTIICNNSLYAAVRGATQSMFKDGAAGADDCRGLANLGPSPPFEQLAQAQGAHAERVERPDELAGALARARDAVVKEGRQALVNVICP